ncbi:beta-lactamase family protein [Flavobacterium sp. F372]|uniref:Beta-lactamase family protein n=1 Tax=Flavobacterium bernardetii TaxID=2813823 RepID=A0ABR7IYE1_9FLAO|nr:serine hydrolase domain-containing protein [Flavobacterium bernardetii]MBC5834795.1 beta-lactamase family protein [Flavobacterium bernardetii]NHF70652.1 beta-lactamase family protein [Flavobacterium bernardetii]
MMRVILFLFVFFTCKIHSQENKTEKIDVILQSYNKPNSPGLSIGIVENGNLIYVKGIGFASVEKNIKNDTKTAFSIASIAKQFTASCIWVLVQEKKLSLDDDIRKYLPEIPNYGTPIKIKHLLNHTSGIRNYHTIMDLQGFDYDSEYYNNETVLQLAANQKGLNKKPGEKVLYSNTNYNLLTIIIERISGKNLNEFAKEKLFKPLQMNSSCFKTSNKQIIENKAVGYQFTNGKYISNTSSQESYGAGSMASTVEDLSKWIAVLNGANSEFKSLSKFLIQSEKLENGEKAKYARGVMVDKYKGFQTISHSGFGWGGQSQLITVPEKNLGVIIMTNLESINPTPISYQILDLFLNEETIEKSNIKKLYQNENLDAFIGQYKEMNSAMKMEIFVENDTLKAKGSQAKKGISLLAFEKNKFHRINNESVTYDFTKDKNKDLIISFGGPPFYFKKAQFVKPETVKINEFVGIYYSEELKTTYSFFEKDNKLFLTYKNNENTPLSTIEKDEFGNNARTSYQFKRNSNNQIVSMELSSEGTVKNISFIKQKNRL